MTYVQQRQKETKKTIFMETTEVDEKKNEKTEICVFLV